MFWIRISEGAEIDAPGSRTCGVDGSRDRREPSECPGKNGDDEGECADRWRTRPHAVVCCRDLGHKSQLQEMKACKSRAEPQLIR
ncbi:hypothetical protein GCM10009000_046120 [Halobacterium noricense]|uniref:Uncharacterized protein n=1 Tax=Haladaptatus pallidirubidus TaxID=1008152 RepID=A0AAV3UFE7_9EURY